MADIIKRKDRGFLENILTLFVSILALAVIMFLAVSFLEQIQLKNIIDQTARRAVLQLETWGYLDEDTREELSAQLLEAGVCQGNIQVRGIRQSDGRWGEVTSFNPAVYGCKVEVQITGNVEWDFPFLTSGYLDENRSREIIRIQSSTGKH